MSVAQSAVLNVKFPRNATVKIRAKAGLIHFVFSLIVVAAAVSTTLYFWYPLDTLRISGFYEILYTLVIVDLCMGPMLTLFVYNPAKKSLKFDLASIVLLQLAALSYGVYTLYQAHPVFMTFAKDQFYLVSARDADPDSAKLDEYRGAKWRLKAKLAYAKPPEDAKERSRLVEESLLEGAPDLEARAEYYVPYKNQVDEVLAHQIDKQTLTKDPDRKKALQRYFDKTGSSAGDFAFLPLVGAKYRFATLLLNKESAMPVGVVDIDPFDE